jgi:hypothetical protein
MVPRKMDYLECIKLYIISLYFRSLLFIDWFIELWNRTFLAIVIEKDDGHYIRVRGNLVRIEIYPAAPANGFRIGNAYYTNTQPAPLPLPVSDGDKNDDDYQD